jgi:hypothetical protein
MSDALSDPAEVPLVELPATIETCHSTWIFDTENRRFRRLLKGVQLSHEVSTDWRSYDHVVFEEDSDAFLVLLDETGTRLLRSRRHLASRCERCGEATTQELYVGDLDREVAERGPN